MKLNLQSQNVENFLLAACCHLLNEELGLFVIETKTNWDDSGYDCQFCGVKIYKRTDHETGRSPRSCFQGEHGCQWSLDGKLMRVGSHPDCQRLQREGVFQESQSNPIPNWVWIVVGAIFLLLILRFGGIVALRLLVPMALGGIVIMYLYRLGRDRQWW